jgi:hypothetical protein
LFLTEINLSVKLLILFIIVDNNYKNL